jgi:hypothetical protein
MKYRFVVIILLILIFKTPFILAEKPDWKVNPSDFQYQGIITAWVNVDFETQNGSDNLLAAFKGNDIRGVIQPVMVADKAYYFLQMYSNQVKDTLSITYYDSVNDTLLTLSEPFIFVDALNQGTLENPVLLSFIRTYNFPPTWKVSEKTIKIETGNVLPDIDLNSLISDVEDDSLGFTVSGNVSIEIELTESNFLKMTYPTGFSGTEELTLHSFEVANPENAADLKLTVVIFPIDVEPVLLKQPGVFRVFNGDNFSGINLNQYFSSPDGNALSFSASLPEKTIPDTNPDWQINASNFELTMNITAEVSFYDLLLTGDNKLGVFVGNELRGFGIPQNINNTWIFFITAYANVSGEQLSFTFWDEQSKSLSQSVTHIDFDPLISAGSVENPVRIEIGGLSVSIQENMLSVKTRNQFSGMDTLVITAQESETENKFSVSSKFVFEVNELARPRFKPVSGQSVMDGNPFQQIDLDTVITFEEAAPVTFDVYKLTDDLDLFTINIDENNVLTVTPVSSDSYGSHNYVFKVSRTDYPTAADSIFVLYERKASYLPPQSFGLVHPEANQQLDSTAITFTWNPSKVNADKTATYTLRIIREGGSSVIVRGLTETRYELDGTEGIVKDAEYTWYVTVTDGINTLESLERRSFIIGTPVSIEQESEIPLKTRLLPNYPNPFNPRTTLRYELSRQSEVSIQVWDLHGRLVSTLVKRNLAAGFYETEFDAANFSSGVYLIQYEIGKEHFYQKVLLVK